MFSVKKHKQGAAQSRRKSQMGMGVGMGRRVWVGAIIKYKSAGRGATFSRTQTAFSTTSGVWACS